MLNNNLRVEKLNKNKQFFDNCNEHAQNNSNQIVDNSRIFHESDVDDNEKLENINKHKINASHNVNQKNNEKTFQKKPRIFSHTLRNNDNRKFFNFLSRRSFVNRNEYNKLYMQFIKFKNKALKLRVQIF